MNRMYQFMALLLTGWVVQPLAAQDTLADGGERFRPFIHFTPREKWMNDPNGMIYHQGVYHLFYQYHPYSSVWGPMHWGHATSTNLLDWEHQPIALYPDSLGMIFSGSAVFDKDNTSGLGTRSNPPLVALFTYHDDKAAPGRNDFQTQGLAYSLDAGKTWVKYAGNPVLKNPGIVDFRDPKVMWFEKDQKWIMTLATKDCITFYSSPNLKDWKQESVFGKTEGAHGGVWECPDLFPMEWKGKKQWVLLVNLNPGGPNGGSATQYFIGDFDGQVFRPLHTDIRWLDYGPDEYAGVTWSNTGNRRLFIGWMSNWDYAQQVPTTRWRSAMTLPRELRIHEVGGKLHLASIPVAELRKKQRPEKKARLFSVPGEKQVVEDLLPARFEWEIAAGQDFQIRFSNARGEEIEIGYQTDSNRYYIDRQKSGLTGFHPGFGKRSYAPRISDQSKIRMELIIDRGSVELFADGGLTTLTAIYFSLEPLTETWFSGVKEKVMGVRAYRLEKR